MKRKMLSILLAGVMILTSFGADVVTVDAAEINNTTNTVTVSNAATGTSVTTVSTATPKTAGTSTAADTAATTTTTTGSSDTSSTSTEQTTAVTTEKTSTETSAVSTQSTGESTSVTTETTEESTEETSTENLYSVKDAADYVASGTCGKNLTWTLDHDGLLVISGSGSMYMYDIYTDKPWSSHKDDIKSVRVENGVTSISCSAFASCTNLESVIIPDSVKEIDSFTFAHCTSLTSVDIPDSVTEIGYDAFWNCTSLAEIDIPDSVEKIVQNAFEGCTSLKSITIPDSVTEITLSVFEGCTSLSSVKISNNASKISNEAFIGCTSLSSIDIPDSVTEIGYHAFGNCTSLTSVRLSNKLVTIGSQAFDNCTKLTSITIPYGVEDIESSVFEYCKSLTNVEIPESVKKIGAYAFESCTGLKTIELPNSLTEICQSAFDGCSGLTGLDIPNGVKSIGVDTFYDCTSLSSVNIPKSITSIGQSAFFNCKGLHDVYYAGSEEDWGKIEIQELDNGALKTATIHYGYIQPVSGITVSDASDIYVGDTVTLQAVISPKRATDKTIKWSITSGSDTAEIEEATGKLKAKVAGNVTVKATAQDGSNVSGEKTFNILPKTISITAADNATKLTSGQTLKFSAVKTPQRNTESGVTWSVDNKSAAKISSGGVLTALNVAEKTTVRVTVSDDAHSYLPAVYEVAIIPKASKVVLSKGGTVVTGQTLGLNVDETIDLTAGITPSDAAQDVTWKSGNSSIASVEDGHVTGLSVGKTDITATSADGTRITGKVTISVCRMVMALQINGNDAMTAGQKLKLSVRCAPDSATNKAVTWTCDDPSRAVVDRNGTVSAVKTAKAGSFNITATAADGSGVTAVKKITITKKAETLELYDNSDNNPRLISNGQKIGFDYDAKELNNKHPEVKLRVEALADNATDGVSQTFTWKSSAPAVAEAYLGNPNEVFIDVFKTGTTVISATTTDGSNLTISCTICVKSQITDITITGQDEISVKKSTVLTAVVSPDSAEAADKKVKWTSSDPAVASVTSAAAQTMTVTGRSAGTATITATAADGAGIYDTGDNAGKNIFGTFTVTVKAGIPDKVMIWNLTKDQEAAKVETLDSYLYKGEPNANFRIDAYVLDKQGGDDVCQDVVWSSSNTAVADVIERDKGDEKRYYVTAAAPGRTTITATTVDGSKKSASITVNVTQSKVQIHGEYEIAVGKSVKLKAYGPGVTWSIAKYDGAEPTAQVLKAIKVSNGTVSVNAKAESIIGADVSGKEITVRATSKLKGDSDNNDDYILTIKDQTQKMVIIDNSDNSDVTGKTVGFERNDLGTEQKMSFMAESRGSSNTTEGISQNITWKISDTRKASLETYYDNAKKTTICIVEPLQAGNVKLTATSTDGTNKSASVTINIAKLVQRLSVGGQTNEVAAGRSIQLTATVLPTNAVNKKVTWNATYTTPDSSTLAKNDITISSSGVIKTKSSVPCKTVIHAAATAMDGSGLTTTYDVTVTKPADNIFILRNDGKAADVYGIDRDLIGSGPWVGFKAEVNGDVGTTEGVSQSVDWKNGNPSVVQVYSYAGILYIRPLKVGKAVITFIAEDGTNTKASMTINVASLATGVEISGDDTNVKQGKSIQLTAKVTPTYAENKKVNWSINILDAQGNPLSAKLATVRNGKVTTNRKIPVGAEITVWADTLDGSLLTSVPYIINVD